MDSELDSALLSKRQVKPGLKIDYFVIKARCSTPQKCIFELNFFRCIMLIVIVLTLVNPVT